MRRIPWRRQPGASRARAAVPNSAQSTGSRSRAPVSGDLKSRFEDEIGHTQPRRRGDDRWIFGSTCDAPVITFLPRDPADPARVQLSVTDEGSGIASVAIEARRRAMAPGGAVRVLRTRVGSPRCSTTTNFRAGKYEVRGHAIDARGQRADALDASRSDPTPCSWGSTTRRSARRSGRGKRGSRWTRGRRCVRRPGADPWSGDRCLRDGRANVAVEVSRAPCVSGRCVAAVTTLRTDKSGSFTYTARRDVARTLRFHYAGTPTTRAAGSEVTLRVRAASTLAEPADAQQRGIGGASGASPRPPTPTSGKLMTLQAWTSRGWLTFGNARARSKDGKWSYRYTFTGTIDNVALPVPGGRSAQEEPTRTCRARRR